MRAQDSRLALGQQRRHTRGLEWLDLVKMKSWSVSQKMMRVVLMPFKCFLDAAWEKASLIYKDTGKQAFSFFDRKNGKKGRIVFKRPLNPNFERQQLQEHILSAPLDELFDLKEPSFELPEQARMFTSVVCEKCGESAPEHKMRLEEGKTVCLECARAYSRGW